jgi:hypothetical protein
LGYQNALWEGIKNDWVYNTWNFFFQLYSFGNQAMVSARPVAVTAIITFHLYNRHRINSGHLAGFKISRARAIEMNRAVLKTMVFF